MSYWARIAREWMKSYSHHEVPSSVTPSQMPPLRRVEYEWPKNPSQPLMTTMLSLEPEGRYKELIDEANEEARRKRMMEYFQTIGAIAGLAALLLMVALIIGVGGEKD